MPCLPRPLNITNIVCGKNEVKYLPELEVNKAKPIRFESYQLGKRQKMVSKDYTHTWALTNFLATPEEI